MNKTSSPMNETPTITAIEKQPKSLDELVKLIHLELGIDKGLNSSNVDISKIISCMNNYQSNEKDWSEFALWDKSRAYTRNLLDDGNGKHFNLMIICWNENRTSPIHDHAGAHCIMKVLQGELTETQYFWPKGSSNYSSSSESDEDHDQNVPNYNDKMKIKSQNILKRNESTYISDKIGLHRVSNNTSLPAVSLHLYTPAYDCCKTFDESSGVEHCSGKCTFFSKGGQICS